MTKEELLKDRYKVIGPYPEMERHNVKVGDILTEGDRFTTTRNQNGDAVFTFEWETFPNIFKKLKWHEDREESDIPEYVSLNPENTIGEDMVVKVTAARKTEDGMEICFGDPNEDGPFENFTHCRYYLPASESEYNSQKQ